MFDYDVAIVGGGPAGSTVGSLLKKYSPNLSVAIFEREIFPRDHIGESLLPTVGKILAEIGAWEEVECAGFPIKIGATYKWGTTDDLWDFNLLDTREINKNVERPAKYEGWRVRSAWQVNRATFDKILLDRSAKLGCDVFQDCGVSSVAAKDGVVQSLLTFDGRKVRAKYYIDASGNAAVIRRGIGVEVLEPPSLRNIAIWDHWEDATWAVTIGTDATRVQVMSLGYGWIWFIPISATQTSIGLVCPAEYYKQSGKRPEELYAEAMRGESRISKLIETAKPSGSVKATKDWSFMAKQMVGSNWFLVGEAAGFADPILAAGITMSMVGALECAYTIIEIERGELDQEWLRHHFEKRQVQRVEQHIRFANFWYSANGHFTDLMDYTAEIAKEAGLKMDAKTAWQWLGTGGFVSLETAGAGLAGHSLEQIANLQQMMFDEESEWLLTKYNVFKFDSADVSVEHFPVYSDGRIRRGRLFRRGAAELPVLGGIQVMLEILQNGSRLSGIINAIREVSKKLGPVAALSGLEALESMLRDGWVVGSLDQSQPTLTSSDIPRTPNIDWNRDLQDPKVRLAESLSN
jgi:flavin-dependent dehydrogenase